MEINVKPNINVEMKMDPVTLVVSIMKVLAATYGSGIIQKAFQKFQAQEVSRADFEAIAPKDTYSELPETSV